jgi:anti-sigma factor RsiW
MTDPHLSPSDAENYVLGALEPEAERRLEAHSLECEACAQLLRREAVLEEQLREVASAAPREDNVIRPARWRPRRVLPLVAAAAAALVFLVLRPEPETPREPEGAPLTNLVSPGPGLPEHLMETPGTVVACPDLTTQEACAAAAAARGLLVQYPAGMGEVPRYEGSTGLPEGSISNRPAPL